MRNLDELRWEQFHIGDIFSVERPSARNKDNYEDGDVPFVASGAINNGVMKCCKPKDDEKLDKRECITVSPVDGSTFYQAYAGEHPTQIQCITVYGISQREKFADDI